MKTCAKCKIEKSFSAFYKRKEGKGGLNSICKQCKIEYNKLPRVVDIRRERDCDPKERKKHLDNYLKRNYGITSDQKKQMFDDQKGRCALKSCGYRFMSLSDAHLDHCHETNKIRGLLCRNCNLGLGLFQDNKERLMEAAYYLSRRGT